MLKRTQTQILPEDKEYFDQKIKFLKKNSQINVLCSFTYITPNYDVINILNELHGFAKNMKFKVFLIIWDMNILANPYFKRYCAYKVKDPDAYIEERLKEVRGIAEAVGFTNDNLVIYKSSELWKRLTFYKEENLFQQFFLVLSQLSLKDFSELKKSSHFFQIALDLFFANYFNTLCPEETDQEIDLIFSGSYKNNLYVATRQIMMDEGIIKDKPLFVLMETIPYFMYDDRVPEWNMKIEEIKYLLMQSKNKTEDFAKLIAYFNDKIEPPANASRSELVELAAKELHDFLSKYKKRYVENNPDLVESMLTIKKREQVFEIGNILRSKISFDILLLADGSRTISEMARELKKSVPTISSYATKLKNLKFIKIDSNGNIKRNIKGIKINFESGSF